MPPAAPASRLLGTRLVTALHLAALLLAAALPAGCGPRAPEHELVQAQGEVVRIPRRLVEDGQVHFFTFEQGGEHGGKRVSFLVRTDGRGALHAHLDACYSCYRYRRGFVVEGSDLVCIACRLAYPIEDEVWDFIGACAPIPVPFALEGDSLVIRRVVLEKAGRYF